MIDDWFTSWLRWLGGKPCFRVHGKARPEQAWRVIDIYATHRRDCASRWPLWQGTCITWTSEVVVVGRDFALGVLDEQGEEPASRNRPVEVAGGRIRDVKRRTDAGNFQFASHSEILAHEIGHTWQAVRFGSMYLPLVGPVTLFREGPKPWNRFENEASELGQFGGIVNGSVDAELMRQWNRWRGA